MEEEGHPCQVQCILTRVASAQMDTAAGGQSSMLGAASKRPPHVGAGPRAQLREPQRGTSLVPRSSIASATMYLSGEVKVSWLPAV